MDLAAEIEVVHGHDHEHEASQGIEDGDELDA